MTKKTQIIKRKGRLEIYDEKKVYASVYAAALNVEYGERKAEKITLRVMKAVNQWVKKEKKKGTIHSSDIREQIVNALKDRDVALLYKHHLDLS